MDRLTERFHAKGDEPTILHNGHRWGPAFFPGKGYEEYSALLDRLAAYEDTGYTPEEIEQGKINVGNAALKMMEEINSLKAENERLRKCHEAELGVCEQHCDVVIELQEQIQQISAERDAAIADIKRYGRGCGTCIHKREGKFCSQGGCYSSWANWEYRGLPNTTTETA